MWLGEPDFDDPGFMPAPYRLAYTPQLILNEPSFAQGVNYHHVFDVDEQMLRFLHEEVLRKVAGGKALTKSAPVYGVCVAFEHEHPMDREDRWPVLLLSYWDCPGFDSNSDRDIAGFVDVPEFVKLNPSPSVGAPCLPLGALA
eukprot:3827971-Rhodomonas_salina.1